MTIKKELFLCLTCVCAPFIVCASGDAHIDPSRIVPGVTMSKVTDAIWTHTGWYRFGNTDVPSHGIIAIGANGIVLVDTQWDNSQTEELLGKIEKKFGKKVVLAIITHAHADKIGGIDTLLRHGIRTISTPAIAASAEAGGYHRPIADITSDIYPLTVEGIRMEVFFPGAAHTKDNITVYFSDYKILFAGCIVKGMNDTTLGNTVDGDIGAYPATLRNILKRYEGAKIVITSHSDAGGLELVRHTIAVAESLKK